MGDARAHLNGRPLAAQGQTRSNGQQPADELHRHQAQRCRRQFFFQHRLNMRDAAAGSVRSKPADEPGGNRRCRAGRDDDQQQPGQLFCMCPSDQSVAQDIRLIECQAEERPDKPRRRACD